MRELSWGESPTRIEPVAEPPDVAAREPGRVWRDGLTLALTAAAFLAVAVNVQDADWVDGLPRLYPLGLAALAVAYALSRLRLHSLLLLPAAVLAGAPLLYLQVLALLDGGPLDARTDLLLDRMYLWWSAVTQSGTSVDPLPVIVIMLALTWLGSTLAAWAILRWRNAVLGLLPGAAALAWDSGFSTDQFSASAVIYLVIGVLLFMRLRVGREERRWLRERVSYPGFIALPVLHATLWATLGLLAAVWVLPAGPQSSAANARWSALTSPVTDRLQPLASAFIGVNPDKGRKLRALRDSLVLKGGIDLRLIPAAQVSGDIPPDVAPFLRAQSFAQYGRDGWRIDERGDVALAAGAPSGVVGDRSEIDPLLRKDVAVTVKVQGANGDRLLSIGQPLRADRAAAASTGDDPADVRRLEPAGRLRSGTQYSVVGSASAATADQLRGAGAAYPDWVTQTYLQLPHRLSGRVAAKAREVAAGTTNPYDAAAAIEAYLRTFTVDDQVTAAPQWQDPVDYFLFDARRGYFDYYASAMTVMLRSLGVPARVASGYVLDPARQGAGGAYRLTEQQAFTWPEVYFPAAGWVEFNPTPSQPLVARPSAPQTQPPAELAPALPGGPDAPGIVALPSPDDIAVALLGRLSVVGVLAGAAALLGVTLVALVFAWERRVRGLSLPARFWEQSVRLATLGRAPPQPQETPRAYAARVAAAVPAAAAIVDVASAYERARFGRKPLTSDDARSLRRSWSTTRAGLLRRIVRWPSAGWRDDGRAGDAGE